MYQFLKELAIVDQGLAKVLGARLCLGMPQGNGVSQAAFAGLIQQVTSDLFPAFNPDDPRRDKSGRCRNNPVC